MIGIGVQRNARGLIPFLAIGALGAFTSSRADAHFKLNGPACWMSQDSSGGPQKNGPCGGPASTVLPDVTGTPTNAVTAFSPGQTISVSVTATIAHPGWWRIALVEGASSTQTLATLADPQAQAGTNCTPAIMTNPVWSRSQPVIADGLPAGSTPSTVQSGSLTFQVTIPPSASCTMARPCTLQVIMVMTDHPPTSCYYHHCADIFSSAADAGGPATGAGGAGAGGARPDAGAAGGATSTGTGAGTGGAASGSGGSGSGVGTTGAGGATGSTGSTTSGATTTTTGGSAGSSATTTGSSGASGNPVSPAAADNVGCSCRFVGPRRPEPQFAWLFGLGLGTWIRRRRRS